MLKKEFQLNLCLINMSSNIKSVYRILEKDRLHQGDILSNFEFPTINTLDDEENIEFTSIPHGVILSQDCDLDGAHMLHSKIQETRKFDKNNPINGNKFLPSIIIAPAFYAEEVNTGKYLLEMGFEMEPKGSLKKSNWKNIENNNNPRYHYLSDINKFLPNLVIDFKIFYTLPYDYLYLNFDKYYTCSLNELVRENLSQRFFNYHARIGLPIFEKI